MCFSMICPPKSRNQVSSVPVSTFWGLFRSLRTTGSDHSGGTSRTSSRRIKRGLPHSPRTIAAGALKAAVGIARLNLQGAGNTERDKNGSSQVPHTDLLFGSSTLFKHHSRISWTSWHLIPLPLPCASADTCHHHSASKHSSPAEENLGDEPKIH